MSATSPQNPNVFKYSNTEYTLIVTIKNAPTASNSSFVECLDNNDIQSFVYTSTLNNLVVTGRLSYLDKYAFIDKMIGQFQLFVSVQFAENFKPSNPTNSLGLPNKDKTLMLDFIVQNIRPVNRLANCIQYDIDLVSINWHKCIANVQFSNYQKDPEPLFDILKQCLVSQDLAIDKDSFNNVKQDVSMNYITSQNDNMFTVTNYLMHKLYYLPTRDQSMKFIVYNMFTDKYHIVDVTDWSMFIGNMTSTALSFFKSNIELLIQQEATNLGSFANPRTRTDLFKSMFNRKVIGYDYDSNQFVNFDIEAKEIKNYMNASVDQTDVTVKYDDVEAVDPAHKRFKSNPYWDNDMNVYGDIIDVVTQNDAVVLNITGNIMRQAGQLLNVSIDRDLNGLTNSSPSELKKLQEKYKQYERLWMTSKVINVVKPNEPSFRQQVALFRNFIPQEKQSKALAYGDVLIS